MNAAPPPGAGRAAPPGRAAELWRRFFTWALLAEGSTRPAAILRVGVVTLLWVKWADEFTLFRRTAPDERLLGLSFYASTLLFFAGAWTRFSGAWASLSAAAAYLYLGLYKGQREAFVHHHTRLLLIATGLVALMPSGRSLSVDRHRAVARAASEGRPPPPERGPLWAQRLAAAQVSLLYFYAAVDKTRPAFLRGDRLEQIYAHVYGGSDYPTWPGFHALVVASAFATTALEYALAVGLWVPRWRRVLLPAGVAFHLALYYAVPVSTFSATMCLLYVAFLDPERVHAALDAWLGRSPPLGPHARAGPPRLREIRRRARTKTGGMKFERAHLAALLSLIVPGAGQLFNGTLLRALFWFIITPGFWVGSGGTLGWLCHLIAAFTAYTYAARRPSLRRANPPFTPRVSRSGAGVPLQGRFGQRASKSRSRSACQGSDAQAVKPLGADLRPSDATIVGSQVKQVSARGPSSQP